MTVKAYPNLHLLPRTEPREDFKPACIQAIHLQEQFIGPVPLRNERPAAEFLAERLAESGPAGPSQLFIP